MRSSGCVGLSNGKLSDIDYVDYLVSLFEPTERAMCAEHIGKICSFSWHIICTFNM